MLYGFNATNILATNTKYPNIIGNKPVHANNINWSNLNLGKLALIHININNIIDVLNPNPIGSIHLLSIGTKYPPKNNIDVTTDINIIFPYSPKKKYAKDNDECSVINPATSSDSASGKSNGALFVSANAAIKNISAIGNNGIIFHTVLWFATIVIKFIESAKNTTINITIPIITSYDIIWAVVLNDPNNAYFEFADHPANIIPNTPNDDINNIYNILYVKSAITIPLLNGITAHANILNTNVIYGATKNNILFACDTNIVSFITNFNPSANGCNTPNTPTLFGPNLLCIAPITFLSANVK
uniref:hypothetical protein n=1 Tax=Conidiobolus polyspermus TaxID=2074866 RepID=UPI001D123674|nr:hypothetical protein LKZ09_mgp05 [Conidiobolus polyspermus]QZZ81368.1 hypothetical protein [Conidiobolus polyspermus]